MTSTKMLQILVDGQASIRKELAEVKSEMKSGFKEVNDKIDFLDKKLTKRIDKLGSQIAYLEDDAPTIEEHDSLEKRVGKLERQVASV